jgi:uncharacterized membrane protein YkvA (DUF1232 family)
MSPDRVPVVNDDENILEVFSEVLRGATRLLMLRVCLHHADIETPSRTQLIVFLNCCYILVPYCIDVLPDCRSVR